MKAKNELIQYVGHKCGAEVQRAISEITCMKAEIEKEEPLANPDDKDDQLKFVMAREKAKRYVIKLLGYTDNMMKKVYSMIHGQCFNPMLQKLSADPELRQSKTPPMPWASSSSLRKYATSTKPNSSRCWQLKKGHYSWEDKCKEADFKAFHEEQNQVQQQTQPEEPPTAPAAIGTVNINMSTINDIDNAPYQMMFCTLVGAAAALPTNTPTLFNHRSVKDGADINY
eukprot:jgi/Psemu1/288494/fgenesh1_pg.264_\